jgi:hypothetical protein
LVIPLATYASNGPCPDDPVASQNCYQTAPPYFVVTNRAEEHISDRPGTGCQPFILNHPDCKDCADGDAACTAIDVDVELCQAYMAPQGLPAGDVIEMCCDCATDPGGYWVYRVREFDGSTCPLPAGWAWTEGLPPGTGIDLPAPVIVGGLAILGAGLLAVGILMRRRTLRTA